MTRVVGVDPGIHGALALVDDFDGPARIAELEDMPIRVVDGRQRVSIAGVVSVVLQFGPVDLYVVERVTPTATGSRASAFTFGLGVGVLYGVLAALGRPVVSVPPRTWTKALDVGADKGRHREEAAARYPDDAALFDRRRDDGRADAALLAFYGLRKEHR